MCVDTFDSTAVRDVAPREALGAAVDPIHLEPVDELVVTMLMDNSYDGLLPPTGPAQRFGLAKSPRTPSAVMASGESISGLVAEHGFSALVTIRRDGREHTLLFDTGISPQGAATNLERLDIDPSTIEAVVLSHGHVDHAGGLEGMARLPGLGRPLVLHPLVWTQRRIAPPGLPEFVLPTLSTAAVEAQGFEVVERRQRSLLLDGSLLVTGEIDRTTDFETGMPFHERLDQGSWEPDPLILDDQAVAVHVRGRGLVVLTGCAHSGAVNTARHAMRLTGVGRLHALLGGFHLGGPAFEPIIEPTVSALRELDPAVVVPAHCTGWRAQHRIAAAMPEAFVPNAVGSRYVIATAEAAA